jgi:hypothetical protein
MLRDIDASTMTKEQKEEAVEYFFNKSNAFSADEPKTGLADHSEEQLGNQDKGNVNHEKFVEERINKISTEAMLRDIDASTMTKEQKEEAVEYFFNKSNAFSADVPKPGYEHYTEGQIGQIVNSVFGEYIDRSNNGENVDWESILSGYRFTPEAMDKALGYLKNQLEEYYQNNLLKKYQRDLAQKRGLNKGQQQQEIQSESKQEIQRELKQEVQPTKKEKDVGRYTGTDLSKLHENLKDFGKESLMKYLTTEFSKFNSKEEVFNFIKQNYKAVEQYANYKKFDHKNARALQVRTFVRNFINELLKNNPDLKGQLEDNESEVRDALLEAINKQ